MRLDPRRWQTLFGLNDFASKAIAVFVAIVFFLHVGLVLAYLVPRFGSLGFLRLHYTASLGVDWVAEWWNLLLLPGFGAAVIVANGLLAGLLSRRDRKLGIAMLVSTAIIETVLAVGGAMAVLLNS